MGRTSVIPLVMVVGFSLACLGPRDPGPLEEEFGQVLFWEVMSFESSNSGCSDASEFQSATELPPLEENTFFMYKVSSDGKTAVAQDCTETRADSCRAVPELTFQIKGHEHTYAPPEELMTTSDGCDVLGRQLWLFEDAGDVGTLDVVIDFPFEGSEASCNALEEQLAADSSNGKGLSQCEVTLTAEMEFVTADD